MNDFQNLVAKETDSWSRYEQAFVQIGKFRDTVKMVKDVSFEVTQCRQQKLEIRV